MVPTMPTAADSVMVAMPAKIEPSTRKISIAGGSRPRATMAATSPGGRSSSRASRGARCGRAVETASM